MASIIEMLNVCLGVPDDIVAVREDGHAQSGAIVAAKTDHH